MNVAYTRIPNDIRDAFERREITEIQFIILFLLHTWCDYRTGCVDSFSSERILRFLHQDATRAALVAIRRQVAGLKNMGWFHWDYVKGSKRPYRVWLHNYRPLSLSKTAVPESVSDCVPDDVALNPYKINPYPTITELDVPDDVPENGSSVCSTNQKQKKDPLNPPSGDFSPSVPQGTHSSAVGLNGHSNSLGHEKLVGNGKPLDTKRCEALRNAGLLYADFSDWLYGSKFVPDAADTAALLREFTPRELLFAEIEKFPPDADHLSKNTMAHFFKKGAQALIKAARLKGTSNSLPEWLGITVKNYPQWDFNAKWCTVTESWSKVFPDVPSTENEVNLAIGGIKK